MKKSVLILDRRVNLKKLTRFSWDQPESMLTVIKIKVEITNSARTNENK